MTGPNAAAAARRRRVVMLAQTAVGPDSRVTKQARSMAELGWDVVVVAPGVAFPVDLGGAQVRTVQLTKVLRAPRSLFRTRLVRSPLAYSSTQKGRYLVRRDRAQLADLYHRVGLARVEGGSMAPLAVAGLRGRIAGRRLRRRWTSLRDRKTNELEQHRKAAASAPDRLSTRFWEATLGDRAWRRLWPGVWEHEFAYGPVVDELAPDLIHANDFMMLAVAGRAKVRAAAAGRPVRVVWDVREYLPGMSPWALQPRWRPAHIALERDFAPYADAVVTVSDPLADLLVADFRLPERPAIVLNAPVVTDPPVQSARDVRSDCGLEAGTPLIVYSGGAAPQRGLEVMVDALPQLPDVHTAFVVLRPGEQPGSYVRGLQARAAASGVADRLHVLEYVDSDEVINYLATADVGVFPGLPFLNHTISLITKFLEYSQARLPIVVSNLKTMAETVTTTGQGEVFEPEDVPSYTAAITRVLKDPDSYRRAYDDAELMRSWSWAPQAEVLDRVYTSALAAEPRLRRRLG